MRNVGEWSEVFVLLRSVVDGVIPVVDSQLSRKEDSELRIAAVLFETRTGTKRIARVNDRIESRGLDGTMLGHYSIAQVEEACQAIKYGVRNRPGRGASFEIQGAKNAMLALGIPVAVHNATNSKVDLYFEQQDSVSGTTVVNGFSVKSFAGAKPTLMNASQSTRVKYEIGLQLTAEDMALLNAEEFRGENTECGSALRCRLKELTRRGSSIAYADYTNPTFKMNLRMIDSLMPELWAFMVKAYYIEGEHMLARLAEMAASEDVLEYEGEDLIDLYRYRLAQFASEVSQGMRPATRWRGAVEVPGGFVIVLPNLEIVSMQPENRMDYWSYLLTVLKLDTPSTGRHRFGEIYSENGRYFIDLNAQLRFS